MDRLSAVLIYTVFISPVVIVSVRIYIIQNIANTYQLHFTVVLRKGECGDYLVFKVYFFLICTMTFIRANPKQYSLCKFGGFLHYNSIYIKV